MTDYLKILLFQMSFLVSVFGFCQSEKQADSLVLRIFNDGKYLIKELKIDIQGQEYVFNDVPKNKYSETLILPYIWKSNNSLTTTVIIKKMFAYDWWVTLEEMPIDHIGEMKIENGTFTLRVKTNMNNKQLEVEQELIKESQ